MGKSNLKLVHSVEPSHAPRRTARARPVCTYYYRSPYGRKDEWTIRGWASSVERAVRAATSRVWPAEFHRAIIVDKYGRKVTVVRKGRTVTITRN
jgi:hypothetical protein